jgi:SET domain-containing protein
MEYLDKIEVKESPVEGKGFFAKEDMGKGEVVLQFKGLRVMNKPGIYTLQISPHKHLLIDEPWRYVNHSCDPNCGIKDKVKLVAMRDIKRGEEITFDYAMSELRMRMECRCGSPNCRKLITGYAGLSRNLKKKYKGFISGYLITRL